MLEHNKWTLSEALLAILAIFFVLFTQETIPFLMMPTLGQAVWSMGFAQSFANGPIFSAYAHDIGIPQPAAIAFGLSGAWPASLLIRLGTSAADAYSGIATLWLGLGFYSAYKISRRFGTTRAIALLGSAAWLTMPIIWAHAGYSMLSWGIALLPFYFYTAFKLFHSRSDLSITGFPIVALYFAAAIISIFMDGYTFMMFATGSSILLSYIIITQPKLRNTALTYTTPIHVVSFALAYVLYSSYIGRSNFDAPPIDFFRGWGVDLAYITIPTRGIQWLPDILGLSVNRSDAVNFGDASVWNTTFFLPTLILGVVAWWRTRSQLKQSSALFLIAVFGLYMALGPSLKVNSVKSESLQISHPRQQSALMPSNLAVMPTGNAWISEKLPGFNVMRASYRWSALGVFALWVLIMMWASRADHKSQTIWLLVLPVLIAFNLPNLQERWKNGSGNRTMFLQIDSNLIKKISQYLHPGEKTLFLPWGNDFMANYIAPKAGVRTFNIGGDKNLTIAQNSWPQELGGLNGKLDADKAQTAATILMRGTTDTLIIPYFDMLWAPHIWPCIGTTTTEFARGQAKTLGIPDFNCPADIRDNVKSFISKLNDIPQIEVKETDLFAVAKLRKEFTEQRKMYEAAYLEKIKYPIYTNSGFDGAALILREGWYGLEPGFVWSRERANLMIPTSNYCADSKCVATLILFAFNASAQHPVNITFASAQQSWHWSSKVKATSSSPIHVEIPLPRGDEARIISISIPEATSPNALDGSPDSRILGVALQQINLTKN